MNKEEVTISPAADVLPLSQTSENGNLSQWVIDRIRSYVKGRVLETGSGVGTVSALLEKKELAIHLSHPDWNFREVLRQQFRANPVIRAMHNVDFYRSDFENEYSDFLGVFNTILALNILETTLNAHLAIANAKLLLKHEGIIILLLPVYTALYDGLGQNWADWKRYNKMTIQNLISTDFNILKTRYFNMPGISDLMNVHQTGLSAIVVARKN